MVMNRQGRVDISKPFWKPEENKYCIISVQGERDGVAEEPTASLERRTRAEVPERQSPVLHEGSYKPGLDFNLNAKKYTECYQAENHGATS